MKHIILSVVAALLSLSKGNAQQYIPMPTGGLTASYHISIIAQGAGNTTTRFQLMLTGDDTVIRTKIYKKLTIRYVTDTRNTTKNVADIEDRFYAGIREENKRVYVAFADSNYALPKASFLFTDTTKDRLLYDFNVNVGDTIPNFDVRNASTYRPVIQAIDSVLIGSRYHKRFKTNGDGNIIEGIGAEDGIFHYGSIPTLGTIFHCQADPSGIYIPFASDSCFYLFPHSYTSVNSVAGDETTNIYPNPFTDQLKIDAPAAMTVSLLDMTGRVLLQENVNQKTILSVGDLNAGIYHVVLKDNTGTIIHTQKLVKQ